MTKTSLLDASRDGRIVSSKSFLTYSHSNYTHKNINITISTVMLAQPYCLACTVVVNLGK